MTTSRAVRTAIALIATALAGAGLAPAASAQGPSPAYLFTVQAGSGTTVPGTAAKGQDERFTLTMRGVDPVTKFADRPFRTASVMSPAALVSNWDAWFADSPPNAVLTYASTGSKPPQSIVVTLTRPRYESTSRTLRFTAVRTYRTLDPSEKGQAWTRPTTPRTFAHASLFIDDAGVYVSGVNGFPDVPLPSTPDTLLVVGQGNGSGPIRLSSAGDVATLSGVSDSVAYTLDDFFAQGGQGAYLLPTSDASAASLVSALSQQNLAQAASGINSALPNLAIGLISAPDMWALGSADWAQVAGALGKAAQGMGALAILDPTSQAAAQSVQDPDGDAAPLVALASAGRAAMGTAAGWSVLPAMGLQPTGGGDIHPPSGAFAGVLAAQDAQFGIQDATGTNTVLSGLDAQGAWSDATTGQGNGANVIPVEQVPGKGTMFWGSRLLQNGDFRYVAERRTAMYLTAAMQQALLAYVFQPNNANTWAAVASALGSQLTQAWQLGILTGATAADAFEVTCQPTTDQILNGTLPCDISMQLSPDTRYSTTLQQQMAISD